MDEDKIPQADPAAPDPPKNKKGKKSRSPVEDPRDDLRGRLAEHRQRLQSFYSSKMAAFGRRKPPG